MQLIIEENSNQILDFTQEKLKMRTESDKIRIIESLMENYLFR